MQNANHTKQKYYYQLLDKTRKTTQLYTEPPRTQKKGAKRQTQMELNQHLKFFTLKLMKVSSPITLSIS